MTHRPKLLEIRDLRIAYSGRDGAVTAVDGVTLDLHAGEILALVGESGSGKTACCLAILGLLDRAARVSGSIRYDGREVLEGDGQVQAGLRGRRIAMIFQEPTGSLNPVRTIGSQLVEMVRRHGDPSRGRGAPAWARAAEILQQVSVPDASERLRRYPHEMSGGQNQRAFIGMMLAHDPQILIADEPTTALDMTTQAQILDLLAQLRTERGMAILLVTHDLGIVSAIADRMAVMQNGRIVELGETAALLADPHHPHTAALVQARLDFRAPPLQPLRQPQAAILSMTRISKSYSTDCSGFGWRGRRVSAVRDVSFEIAVGQAFGLIGESGSGKSTLARIAAGIDRPDAGTVVYGAGIDATRRKDLHRRVQYVFQDPRGALDRRLRVLAQLREPLDIHRIGTRSERDEQCLQMLRLVELTDAIATRFPHELSGGQRQRVVLARALMLQPKLLVCDEPVASLDAATQTQILTLLRDLRTRLGLSLLFVSHDLAQVRHLCDEVAVLRGGTIVEMGGCEDVLGRPHHPYTRGLVAAIPDLRAAGARAATAPHYAVAGS